MMHELEGDVEWGPADLAARLRSDRPPAVVDVREPWEWDIARIEGSRLVPLGQLEERLDELDPTCEVVLVCHRGARSLAGRALLVEAGFRAVSLRGGIDAWAVEIEPGMPRY
jgi:rhodanese-related sulfurtransferase